MDRSYKTVLSQLEDLDDIHEIFMRSTDLLLEQKIKQWDYSYPAKEDIARDIHSNECYKIIVEESILGTVCLNESQDEQYQHIPWVYPGKVLVIHRLAVHPSFYGKGIGQQLCQFSIKFARDHGYQCIRLDAYSGNPYSNRLYEKLGFIKADGFCYFYDNEIPFNCWEFNVI